MASTAPELPPGPLLELRRVSLQRHGVPLLRAVDLAVAAGQVHAVAGPHGEGKSCLSGLLGGQLRPDSGAIVIRGQSFAQLDPRDRLRFGIEIVPENLQLFERLSVAENLLVRATALDLGFFVSRRRRERLAAQFLADCGFDFAPARRAGELPVSERTVLYILRCLYRQPALLLLEKTLEKLEAPHRRQIVKLLLAAKARGLAILWVTDNIEAINDFADRLTIIRNGEVLLTDDVASLDRTTLVKLCYLQVTREQAPGATYQEFYNLLKYNEAILRKLPVNLLVLDARLRVRLVNESGQALLAAPPEVLFARELDELLGAPNPELRRLVDSAVAARNLRALHNVSVRLTARELIADVAALPILDGATVLGTILLVEDVTEQEGLRQRVILAEKLAAVGLLAAGVAHEINNPLEIIHNYVNLLRLKTAGTDLGPTLDELEEEVAHIGQIVSNLVSFSAKGGAAGEAFDLNETIRGLLKLVHYNADYRCIRIELRSAAAGLPVRGNRNEIKQVLLNLLRNSIEAMPEGGEIVLETSLAAAPDSAWVLLRHRDSGPGLPQENPNDVFLPFFSTKKARGNNLGLGLSIVYGIVQQHGGEISARNLPEGGCEFLIRLPLAPPPG